VLNINIVAFNSDFKSVVPQDIADRVLAGTLVWSEACSGSFEYDNVDPPLADTMSNLGPLADSSLLEHSAYEADITDGGTQWDRAHLHYIKSGGEDVCISRSTIVEGNPIFAF
jgi:hypothetical protein